MRALNLNIGDLLKIPYGQNKFALCQVVWISNLMKNCIGFVVLSTKVDVNENNSNSQPKSINLPVGKITTIYANIKNVEKGLWTVVGNKKVDNIDDYITHDIGGHLYIGDEFQRSLAPNEYSEYRKVLGAGNKAVELFLEQFESECS